MRTLIIALFSVLALMLPSAAQEAAPDTSAIEEAHAAWTAKANRKTRKAFDAALDEYVGPATTVTVLAHLDRVRADGKANSPSKLRTSSVAAADHLEPAASQLPQQYAELRFVAATALFNSRQHKDALTEMTRVEGMAYQLKESVETDVEAYESLFYKADAWGMAMEAFFDSTGKRRPKYDELEAILKSYEADNDSINAKGRAGETVDEETGEPRLPFCEGGLDMKPPLRYPSRAARKGMVGAVIASFSHDENGAVIAPEILASIPDEGFNEIALKTVSQWTYKAADHETPGETCRLERDNLILPMTFALDH